MLCVLLVGSVRIACWMHWIRNTLVLLLRMNRHPAEPFHFQIAWPCRTQPIPKGEWPEVAGQVAVVVSRTSSVWVGDTRSSRASRKNRTSRVTRLVGCRTSAVVDAQNTPVPVTHTRHTHCQTRTGLWIENTATITRSTTTTTAKHCWRNQTRARSAQIKFYIYRNQFKCPCCDCVWFDCQARIWLWYSDKSASFNLRARARSLPAVGILPKKPRWKNIRKDIRFIGCPPASCAAQHETGRQVNA